MIIGLVNIKGGAGKTTLAYNLAHAMAAKDISTLLVDADPQGSAAHWYGMADQRTFDCIARPTENLHRELHELDYKHIVVDAPPGTGNITLSILLGADLAVIPVRPSPVDIWSTNEMIELVREAQLRNSGLRAGLLVSQKVIGTVPGREGHEALKSYGLMVFKTEICARIDHVRAMMEGKSVLEYAPSGAAAEEIRGLCSEIIRGGKRGSRR